MLASIKRRFDRPLRQAFQLEGEVSTPVNFNLASIYPTHEVTAGGLNLATVNFFDRTAIDHSAAAQHIGLRGNKVAGTVAGSVTRDDDNWLIVRYLAMWYQAGTSNILCSLRLHNVVLATEFNVFIRQAVVPGGRVLSGQQTDSTNYTTAFQGSVHVPPGWDAVAVLSTGGVGATVSQLQAMTITVPIGSPLPF